MTDETVARPSKKLDCPFCGGRDIRSHHRGHPTSGEWVIECHNCSCELTGFGSEQQAWERWNKRPPSETSDDLTDKQRLDFLEAWLNLSKEEGFKWNTFALDTATPVREQIDQRILAGMAERLKHGPELKADEGQS